MRRLLLIGIGTGDPEHLTVQAVRALNEVDVFIALDKGPNRADLVRVRREICERYIAPHRSYRFVEAPDPLRDRTAEAYRPAVESWSRQRAEVYERLLDDELGEDGCGGILVWGDPSLYDGTLRTVEQIAARGRLRLDVEVVPGISSVQLLAARHRITLNRIGRPVQITTGRLLADGLPEGVDDVVVMLDGGCAFRKIPDAGIDIYWGAYLGTGDEILISGPLAEVAGEIEAVRERARDTKGWIMDTYLLRRSTPG